VAKKDGRLAMKAAARDVFPRPGKRETQTRAFWIPRLTGDEGLAYLFKNANTTDVTIGLNAKLEDLIVCLLGMLMKRWEMGIGQSSMLQIALPLYVRAS